MVKVTHALVASVCCMLAASVIVVVVAVMFRPSESETATQIKILKAEVTCIECRASSNINSPQCEKCDTYWNKNTNADDERCDLTQDRKKQLEEVVSGKMADTTQNRLSGIMDKIVKQRNLADEISKLNLNVPRPSAHWRLASSPFDKIDKSSNVHNITRWTWRKDAGMVHSQNGIHLYEDGLMKFAVQGWYHLYFQMDFQSEDKVPSSYKARVFVWSGVEDDEKNYLMTRQEIKKCRHDHSCVVLSGSGTFKLVKDDTIRVEVEMPQNAKLHTHVSRSYLGALYLRHA